MRLEKKACAFIDILGFSAEINKAHKNGKSKEQLDKLINALEVGTRGLDHPLNKTVKYKLFSDNIFLTTNSEEKPFSKEGIGEIIEESKYYQLGVIDQGFFLRGAIVYEEIDFGEKYIYGKAIIDAHEMESKDVIYPMIALNKEIIKKIVTDEKVDCSDILIDKSTGNTFINYLYMEQLGEGYYNIHKDHILQNLKENKGNQRVLNKYLWLADYHNFCVTNYFEYSLHPDELNDRIDNINDSYDPDYGSWEEFKKSELKRLKNYLYINTREFERYSLYEFSTFDKLNPFKK